MRECMASKVSLGDIIKIDGKKNCFVVVSSNTFNKNSSIFYVCPVVDDALMGPFHINIKGKNGAIGTAICENVIPINSVNISYKQVDNIPYAQVIEISDILQGIFEYD